MGLNRVLGNGRLVIPAQAGIQSGTGAKHAKPVSNASHGAFHWIPACAGMTASELDPVSSAIHGLHGMSSS
jgi:hypothetical protein